jgi:glucose-1-phosphate thymidylyltransferase
MKGIVLAGGAGSRLWPMTHSVCKQLLPVYDKPLIYYPLSTLMLAGVREILIITAPHEQENFKNVLGDGSDFGLNLTYCIQPRPEGLAQALILGEEFLDGEPCLLILGDNIFHGAGLGNDLRNFLPNSGAQIFTYRLSDPENYGVVELDKSGVPISIEEKPRNPKSNLVVTGLYFFDEKASAIAKNVKPSTRGELEITSVIQEYLTKGELRVKELNRGFAWLDTGTPKALHDAASYIRIIEERTGLKIACLEEIAYSNSWIDLKVLSEKIEKYKNNDYGAYVYRFVSEDSTQYQAHDKN